MIVGMDWGGGGGEGEGNATLFTPRIQSRRKCSYSLRSVMADEVAGKAAIIQRPLDLVQ